jgi:lipopolysaccharide/colanic/teichoic acid biosynthesis glycosyltransferase
MYRHFFKRLMDLCGALLILPLLLPVLILVSVAIIINDFGNPIFKQERVGLNGKVFGLYKLRSMILQSRQKSLDYRTSANDVRITKVGHFIRKTSLDELPQVLNVLFGHMSFVGPRPDVPKMEELYSPEDWKKRCSVKPGITGFAQVTSRSMATPEERLSQDLTYVEQLSLFNDIEILLKTVGKVLKFKGTN